jgi:hypothetical protein
MRGWTRLASLCALLAAAFLAGAPATYGKGSGSGFEATGSMVEVDGVPGRIYDVDATRILFRNESAGLSIKNRLTQQTASLSLPDAHQLLGGFLTPAGALLTSSNGELDGRLYELRDGTFADLGAIDPTESLRVAGDFAIWRNGKTLTRRTISTQTNVVVTTNAGNEGADVAVNGDVVYSSDDRGIKRYRGTTTSTLASEDDDGAVWHGQPLTDGTNVVWRQVSHGFPGIHDALRINRPDAAFTMPNTLRTTFTPRPREDYQVAGGWVATTQGEFGATEVWLHAPPVPGEGEAHYQLDNAGGNAIGALAPDGDVVLRERVEDEDHILLAGPGGGEATPVGSVEEPEGSGGLRGFSNHYFKTDGRWYGVFTGSLRRIATGKQADGRHTSITAAPSGDGNPTHAQFSFSDGLLNADFECKLDQGPYEPCGAPGATTYTSLAAGEHTFAVRDAGNGETEPATATWGVEQVPPAVGLAIPQGLMTNDRTPTFGGAAGTADEDTDAVTLRIYALTIDDAHLRRTVQATRNGAAWSATVTPALPDGLYVAQAQQSDLAGNAGFSEDRTFVVDGTPPEAVYGVSPEPVLTGHQVTFDAGASDDDDVIVRYEWDLDGDGDFERDTGASHVTKKTYSAPGQRDPAVRATDRAGNRAVYRAPLVVAPDPPGGLTGVTINGGARFTNDPDVVVSPVWPAGRTHVILSNDGGFGDFVRSPLADSVPWRLDSSGPERLPKTIYARFTPNGVTYQDDIILDETPPTVTEAEITGVGPQLSAAAVRKRVYHLHVRARDATAGVSRMRIASDRSKPGPVRRYRRAVDFRSASAEIFVKVRDRAGNWSRWKRCKR